MKKETGRRLRHGHAAVPRGEAAGPHHEEALQQPTNNKTTKNNKSTDVCVCVYVCMYVCMYVMLCNVM